MTKFFAYLSYCHTNCIICSYLTLNVDLTLQAFDAMHAFIKQSKITNPGDCTSSDR